MEKWSLWGRRWETWCHSEPHLLTAEHSMLGLVIWMEKPMEKWS